MSEDEKEIFLDCLKKIKMEIQRPIDKHSKGLIARNIELLLDYCIDVYKRQVLNGAASSLYGSDAIGGVINIITNEPKDVVAFSSNSSYTRKNRCV